LPVCFFNGAFQRAEVFILDFIKLFLLLRFSVFCPNKSLPTLNLQKVSSYVFS